MRHGLAGYLMEVRHVLAGTPLDIRHGLAGYLMDVRHILAGTPLNIRHLLAFRGLAYSARNTSNCLVGKRCLCTVLSNFYRND